MRQQQRQRSRGRGRKSSNPLTRSHESNGPDVKIRGNAAHIADKYNSLARDALSNGDSVMAENYFQHAEHYNRIVAAAQPVQRENPQADRTPQPEIEGMPAEAAMQSAENLNSEDTVAQEGESPAAENKPRRPRRTARGRANGSNGRPRKTASDVEATDTVVNGDNKSDSQPNEKSDDNAREFAGEVTGDAASLPSSVIGSPEKVQAEEVIVSKETS